MDFPESASAIDLIQKTAIAAAGLNRLDTPMPAIILTDDKGRQGIASLEQYQDLRARFRGTLTTSSLDDYIAYVSDHANGGGIPGFVDVDSMPLTSKVFFNLGNEGLPGHADWTATLTLKPTAAFAALLAIDGKQLTQKQLADWLEDWNEFNSPEYPLEDGSLPATLARAVVAVRKVTINSKGQSTSAVTNTSASRSAMEEIEAKSDNDLPEGFSFVCEPYLGLQSRRFRLVLSVLTGEDKPRLVLRWQQREALIESIAQEFKTVLADRLGDKAKLTVGKFTP